MSHSPQTSSVGIVNMQFGARVKIVEPVNLYGAVLGNDCFIGPFTEIQSGVKIGDRCRVQSHSFICSGVTIGNDCFIGHGVMFINDDLKAGTVASKANKDLQQTLIGDRVSIGSNATILPVSICNNVVIGAGAVVTASIEESGFYAGNPARKIRNI